MILVDSNLLLYGSRSDATRHEPAKEWLERTIETEAVLLVDLVVVAVVRIATDPRIFEVPSTAAEITGFLTNLRARPRVRTLRTAERHQRQFLELAGTGPFVGKDVPDVYLAAVCRTERCRLASADHGFSRFPELDWFDPLDQ